MEVTVATLVDKTVALEMLRLIILVECALITMLGHMGIQMCWAATERVLLIEDGWNWMTIWGHSERKVHFWNVNIEDLPFPTLLRPTRMELAMMLENTVILVLITVNVITLTVVIQLLIVVAVLVALIAHVFLLWKYVLRLILMLSAVATETALMWIVMVLTLMINLLVQLMLLSSVMQLVLASVSSQYLMACMVIDVLTITLIMSSRKTFVKISSFSWLIWEKTSKILRSKRSTSKQPLSSV